MTGSRRTTPADSAVARWMRSLPGQRIAFRADSLVAMREAAAAGIGIAALPRYPGDSDMRLVRVGRASVKEIETALWLLTHADLRHTARVRAFMEFIAKALGQKRALLEGRRPVEKAPQ